MNDPKIEMVEGQLKPFSAYNYTDENGVPTGGNINGCGFTITWQNGQLREPDSPADQIVTPNGAFVEDVIKACIDRLEFYQDTPYKNSYNTQAIEQLNLAVKALNQRTAERQARGVEGTHIV